MKLTEFFIKHPVIAVVLNIMITVIGALCWRDLPLREYPKIELPTLSVYTHYPNASAELVESTVTNLLEDQLASVEGVNEIISRTHQGSSYIELNFQEGTSLDRAMIAVRDAIGLARSNFPKEVLEPVIQRRSASEGPPFIAVLVTSDHMDFGALTHYVDLNIKNSFRALKGVASVETWGQPYTMAVTLDAKKMYAFGVNADDIISAFEQYNVSLPVGKFRNEIPTTMDLTLDSPKTFERLVIKEYKEKPIFLSEIADIQLKTDDKRFRIRYNGKPALVIAIKRTADANPLDVSDAVHEQIKVLAPSLPSGLKIEVNLDQTTFIRASLKNIQSSLFEAIFLVLVVVFIFLRKVRATLVPLVAIPISMIGSLVLLKGLGFSINTITMLAMVLAIGLVVDDAIVVLENIARHVEEGMAPLRAAIQGSREIGFAIVAMTLTLASVYAPIAFIQGAVGQLFIEFAVALAGSVLVSGIVALTLSPLMCRYTLKLKDKKFWPQIDCALDVLTRLYDKALSLSFRRAKLVLAGAVAALIFSFLLFHLIPHEMAPREDRGLLGVYIPSIPGKDINTMEQKALEVEKIVQEEMYKEAQSFLVFMGDWGANVIVPFKDFSQRQRSPVEVTKAMEPKIKSFPSFDAWTWSWDSGLPGMEEAMDSSSLDLAISTTQSYKDLLHALDELRKSLEEKKLFDSVRHNLQLNTPGYTINVDPYLLSQMGITPFQIAKTVEIFFSGDQHLTFQKDGLRYPITIKGEPSPWTLNDLYITTPRKYRVSLGALLALTPSALPKDLNHYNQMHSATLSISLLPQQNMDQAMSLLWHEVKNKIPETFRKEWVGAAKVYLKSKSAMVLLFTMALVFIYAILAVQFESFKDPFIIMLTVPLACCGALVMLWLLGQSLNVYTQIGLVTLIGLITKHGILIVEFANQLRQTLEIQEAVQKAAVLRLRPILMTSAAMIFGAIPLIVSQGAGSEARRAIGIVLVAGLGFGTVFTLFLLPNLYQMINLLGENWKQKVKFRQG